MVSLHLVGGLSRCRTLPNEIDVGLFDRIQPDATVARSQFWQENVDALDKSTSNQDINLKRAVDRYVARARANVTPKFSWMYQDWLELKRSVAEEIQRLIAPSEIVVVAGEESISRWLTNSIRVHSFPEEDGVFWGAPADDITAVKYLEQARQKGAHYFVVDRECFWWLEHYKALREHLDRICRTILSNEKMIVYELPE